MYLSLCFETLADMRMTRNRLDIDWEKSIFVDTTDDDSGSENSYVIFPRPKHG